MPYRVKLTETAHEIISHFHPDLRKLTRRALREVAQNPLLGKELQQELEGYLSYRFNRYRAIYTVNDAEELIVVHLVWHRNNVYDLLESLIPAQQAKKGQKKPLGSGEKNR